MQRALNNRDEMPMMEINTTPLIDVMLVLLIMFIITIPIQTHAVKVDIPAGPPAPYANPIKNKVVITKAGQILWNEIPISLGGLLHNLVLTQRMQPIPELHLQLEAEARYEVVDKVLAITKQARVEKMGFVGNDRYAEF